MPSTPARRPAVDDLVDELVRDKPTSGIPPALPGERHRSLEEMGEQLACVARPLAKAKPERLPRAEQNAQALARYQKAIDFLMREHRWSWRKIARHLRCTVTTVQAVYKGHRYVPSWMLDGLPREARAEAARIEFQQINGKVG